MSLRLIACADLHLGFRAGERVDAEGVNHRERDVERTFATLVDRIIARAPDVITIAGDVVHQPRPANRTIITLLRGFGRLRHALPATPIVVPGGNHDVSASRDARCILEVLEGLGVHVATREAKRFYFPEKDLSILAVPDAGIARPALVPDPRAKYNVLVIHSEAAASTQLGHAPRPASEVSDEELNASAWTVACFGHYHQFEQLAPNAFYSGSIDLTSSSVWKELGAPKGFVERDLETGAQTFHELPPSRRYVDCPPIDAADLTPAEVMTRLTDTLDAANIDEAVVRCIVTNITRETKAALDPVAIRRWRRRALILNLDCRRPEPAVSIGTPSAARQQRSLREIVTERLASRPGIDTATLTARALDYLAQATEQDLPRTTQEAA